MANKSWNITTLILEENEMQPDKINTGTAAPTNDLEVRVNLAHFQSNQQIIRGLLMIIRRIEDGRLASNDTGLV